jgi:predicted oxidoreductase (fatty acid repression mutant protein)
MHNTFINSNWNKGELSDQCKGSIILRIYKKDDQYIDVINNIQNVIKHSPVKFNSKRRRNYLVLSS